MITNKSKTIVLNDVVILRPIAIVLLVVYHAFIIYRGGWKAPEGFMEIKAYWWIATASYSFMLELFVMMSGYVFGFQFLELKRKFTLKLLTLNKLKRLILPSVIFSIIYYILLKWNEPFRPIGFIYNVLTGIGHMWFLPMLFWCFIGAYILLFVELKDEVIFFLCVCLALLSFLPLPFGIGPALYYLLFFFSGIMLYKYREKLLERLEGKSWILIGVAYLITFLCFTIIFEEIVFDSDRSLAIKVVYYMLSKTTQIIYSTLGCLFAWLLVSRILQQKKTVPKWIITANELCFGVYIFQQFILQILYYKTSMPILFGAYWLPFLGFVITLFLSVLLTFYFRKNKIGKLLIG